MSDISSVIDSVERLKTHFRELANAARKLGEICELYSSVSTKSNNWLKRHGYPMRRKIRR